MRIGEMAARFGVNTRTLRYYERCGLLATPARTESNYRVYGEAHARRIAFVLKAKRVGLTLREVQEVLTLAEGGVRPCERVRQLIDDKIVATQREIERLTRVCEELVRVRDTDSGLRDHAICSIIEADVDTPRA